MKIAVLGTGSVGSTLGTRWAHCGHAVHFGSRRPSDSDTLARLKEAGGPSIRLGSWQEAVVGSDAVLLAIPWRATDHVLGSLGETLDGHVVIDCVNPLNATYSGLELGYTTSASEKIADLVPRARVVKAFNTVSAATMANPFYANEPATLFYCGDDEEAKQVVAQLAQDLDFQAVDTGALSHARYLEPLAMLYIYLAATGWGSNCAFRIVRRE